MLTGAAHKIVDIYPDNIVVGAIDVFSPGTVAVGLTGQAAAAVKSIPWETEHTNDDVSIMLLAYPVTWESSDATKFTVDSAGVITGVAIGTAQLTAVCRGIRAGVNNPATITISAAPVVTTVDVLPSPIATTMGTPVTVRAFPKDAGGNVVAGQGVTWSVVNPAICTVGADSGTDVHSMTITPVSAGSTTIKATSTVDSPNITVTVSASGDLFVDGFTGGNTAVAQNGIAWGQINHGAPDIVAIVADAGNASGFSYGLTYAGNPNMADDAWVEPRLTLPDFTQIFVEVVVKTPSGYFHRQPVKPDPPQANNKGLRIWDQEYGNSVVHVGWSTLPKNDGTGRSQFITEFNPSGGTGMGNYSTGPWTTIFAANSVYTIGYYAHVASAVGAADGTIKVWLNGALIYNRSDLKLNKACTAVGHANVFRNMYLFGWSNSGFTNDTQMLIRKVRISTTSPS